MNYKKFKPELSDKEVEDLEKQNQKEHSEYSKDSDETKDSDLSKIKIILIDGTSREMEWDLTKTTTSDVISKLFQNEIKDGK